MKNLPTWLKNYFRAPFVAIVWVMETFKKNRERLRNFMSMPLVVKLFKVLLAVTIIAWLSIAFMANEEQGKRLTNTLQEAWSETQKTGDKP